MHKKLLIIILSIVTLSIAGCTWLNKKAKQNPPTDKHMICEHIKHQILFGHDTGANLNNKWNAYNRRNQLLSQYKKFNCKEIEEKESNK